MYSWVKVVEFNCKDDVEIVACDVSHQIFDKTSHKLHGAYNIITNLPQKKLKREFFSSLDSNHAQEVALAA